LKRILSLFVFVRMFKLCDKINQVNNIEKFSMIR
jgi:hypothetical protein